MAFDPSGRLHFSDQVHHRIFRVEGGRAVVVAGNGPPGRGIPRPGTPIEAQDDARPAASSPLDAPGPLAFRGDDLVFGEDKGAVRRVTRLGRIATILGPEVSSDSVTGVAFEPDGTLVIASRPSTLIGQMLRIPGGSRAPEVLAGSGLPHCCGDGAPASEAVLSEPEGIAVAPDGDLVIADRANHRIRRVERSGKISTVAGNGLGFASGGGQALRELIGSARGMTLDPRGDLVYSTGDGKIWRVTLADGMVRLVAGGDRWKIQPLAIAFDRQGVLCFSEPATARVRAIRP